MRFTILLAFLSSIVVVHSQTSAISLSPSPPYYYVANVGESAITVGWDASSLADAFNDVVDIYLEGSTDGTTFTPVSTLGTNEATVSSLIWAIRDGQVGQAEYRIAIGVDGPGLNRTARLYSQIFEVDLSTNDAQAPSGLPAGAIAGAVIGTLLCVIVLVWVVWNLLRRKGVEVKYVPGLNGQVRKHREDQLELGDTKRTAIVDGKEQEVIVTTHQKPDVMAGFDAQYSQFGR